MRKNRRETLGDASVFHKMWRGHNREHIFADHNDKKAYLRFLCLTMTAEVRRHVEWFSYCLMGNHTHENCGLKPARGRNLDRSIQALGAWMRNGHSRFGQQYNRNHDRQGKVAYDRPKTSQVRDTPEDKQRAIFYGDANPVRAGIVKHPSQYRHSSYRFYAYGETDEVTAFLTLPDWYLALAKTPEVRQKRYRQLCDRYLREQGLLNDEPLADATRSPGSATCRIPIKGKGRSLARKRATTRAGPRT